MTWQVAGDFINEFDCFTQLTRSIWSFWHLFLF
uniref:Uncharacterized protein n=1 Tax=Rhizophora mucronata TaxID=61149 RepID=A0A2P2P361_RHIMU